MIRETRKIVGTGPKGRITLADLRSFCDVTERWPGEVVPKVRATWGNQLVWITAETETEAVPGPEVAQ